MAYPTNLSPDAAPPGRVIGGSYEGRAARTDSAVSWGAVVAGAAAAAALSLILLVLGMGLGLSSVSPWANAGATATTLAASTIVWVTLTQLLACAMGGYLAGRLRTRWVDAQADEVYFRDTAHGFLAWAVSSLATAALLTSVISTIVGGSVQAGATVAEGAAVVVTTDMATEDQGSSMAYLVDKMFRREAGLAITPSTATTTGASSTPVDTALTNMDNERELAEIGRILMFHNLSTPLPQDDVRYVGQLVARRTGLSQEDAQKRVTDTYARAQSQVREAETDARAAAETARKASATAALWLFVSLLIGAFCASLAATFGGRQRDA